MGTSVSPNDLQDSEDARESLSAVEVRVPVEVAVGKVARAMGLRGFFAKVTDGKPERPRAINPAPQPTQDTLNRLPRPSKLAALGAVRPGFIGPVIARTGCV